MKRLLTIFFALFLVVSVSETVKACNLDGDQESTYQILDLDIDTPGIDILNNAGIEIDDDVGHLDDVYIQATESEIAEYVFTNGYRKARDGLNYKNAVQSSFTDHIQGNDKSHIVQLE